jgi:hypothetical protein
MSTPARSTPIAVTCFGTAGFTLKPAVMNPILSQWLPAFVMLLAIWFGILYNNKGLDDFKDLMRAEAGSAKSDLRLEMMEMEKRMTENDGRILGASLELKGAVQALNRRVEGLEGPWLRTK